MGIHYRLPASRLVAQGGPVTRALAVMTAGDPETARIRALRRSIAARIEADIALLDALSGDADFEDGGDDEPGADDEPSLGSLNGTAYARSQLGWSAGDSSELEDGDDCGITDEERQIEQARRFMDRGGNLNLVQGIRR